MNKKSYLDFTFGYSYYKRRRNIYYKDLTTLESFLTDGNNDQDTTIYNNFLFRGYYSNKVKKDKFSFLIGTEFKHDFIRAGRVQGQSQNIGNYAVYGSIKYQPIQNIIIQPSIRYAYNTRYIAPIIPSVIVQVDFKSFKFKGFYAKGFRTPSLKELYLEFHYNETINLWGNENLTAENSDHFMLSAQYDKGDFKVETKAFYNKIKGLIDLVQISDIDWRYDNIGYFITKGANINASYSHKSILLNVGYSYIGTYDAQFSSTNFKNQFYYNSNINANLKYLVKKWDAGITVNYKYIDQTNSFYLTDAGTIENSSIGEYSILDFSLFKRFFDQKMTIVTGVNNVMNTTEVDLVGNIYGFSTSKNADKLAVLWGRTAFVSLKFKL